MLYMKQMGRAAAVGATAAWWRPTRSGFVCCKADRATRKGSPRTAETYRRLMFLKFRYRIGPTLRVEAPDTAP